MKHAQLAVRLVLAVALLLLPVRAGAPANGSQSCPASGNKRLTTTTTKFVQVSIQATCSPTANTGYVTVGGPNVSTTNAAAIQACGAVSFAPTGNTSSVDLSQIYIACTVAADSVVWTGLQ